MTFGRVRSAVPSPTAPMDDGAAHWTTEWITEQALVARARRRIGLLVAVVGAVLISLAGAVAYGLLVHGQEVQIDRELAYSLTVDDAAVPPGCTWVFVQGRGGRPTLGVPAPAGFPLSAAMDDVVRTGIPARTTLALNGTVYHVVTQRRGGQVAQAVFDARYQLADRRQLLHVILVGEVVGLAVAALTGLALGRRAVAPLAEALSRQRRFVADASHELRTPIAQVHTRAQLMARRAAGAQLPGEHLADLDRLIATTRLLGEVVDDLLMSARLSIDRGHSPLGPVDLAALAQAAVLAETDRADERGVAVRLSRPEGPVLVRGAASPLRRVVGELLANALAHTPSGGTIEVVVTAPSQRGTTLVVRDTGTGFDPADARRIFDRFHRGTGDPTERRFGLGLALVREVVAGHGGRIEAISAPGQGAQFIIRLPAPAGTRTTMLRDYFTEPDADGPAPRGRPDAGG